MSILRSQLEYVSGAILNISNTQIVYFSGMKAATLNEIKQELTNLPSTRVLELCLRLGRFKKENKELLTYLLFEAHNIPEFIENIKIETALDLENENY